MRANYGYMDAEGEFYITIDTEKCEGCPEMPCVAACPKGLLIKEEDPFGADGEEVAAVDDAKRNALKYECSECKPSPPKSRPPLPCIAACPFGALAHSW